MAELLGFLKPFLAPVCPVLMGFAGQCLNAGSCTQLLSTIEKTVSDIAGNAGIDLPPIPVDLLSNGAQVAASVVNGICSSAASAGTTPLGNPGSVPVLPPSVPATALPPAVPATPPATTTLPPDAIDYNQYLIYGAIVLAAMIVLLGLVYLYDRQKGKRSVNTGTYTGTYQTNAADASTRVNYRIRPKRSSGRRECSTEYPSGPRRSLDGENATKEKRVSTFNMNQMTPSNIV